MNTIEGLATSSTAIVSRLRCSTDRPLEPAGMWRMQLCHSVIVRDVEVTRHWPTSWPASQVDNVQLSFFFLEIRESEML